MTELDRAKLLAARFRAATQRPYFSAALYALVVVESRAVPTMGVDRHFRCYVNPDFVARLSVEELSAVWVHEAGHLLRAHPDRADRLPAELLRDWQRVNVAMDCELNDDIRADGFNLPGGVFPEQFGLHRGGLFEGYLPRIPSNEVPCNCGSGAHGVPMPWDVEGEGALSVGPTEREALRRQVAREMEAWQRARGNLPAGWQRWATQIVEPRVDWRQRLRGAVREAVSWASGAVDYSYARPSRRQSVFPRVVLPSLREPTPRVAVVIDTSGSMSQRALGAALGELTGVLRSVGLRGERVRVLACDAAVHTTQSVVRAEDVKLAGGGGTNMTVGIERALNSPNPPQIVVVLTDGITPWPAAPLRARVIAGLIGRRPPAPPRWIEAVQIPLGGD